MPVIQVVHVLCIQQVFSKNTQKHVNYLNPVFFLVGQALQGLDIYHELKSELETITANTCKYTYTPNKRNIHKKTYF